MNKEKPKYIYITVSNSGLIPIIGRGPITRPTKVEYEAAVMLKKLGFNVRVHKRNLEKILSIPTDSIYDDNNFAKDTVANVSNIIEDNPIENSSSPSTEIDGVVLVNEISDEKENIIEDNSIKEDNKNNNKYTIDELNSMTKKELKKILDSKNISYEASSPNKVLVEIIMDKQ